jgi:hypothetical protein
MASVTDDDALAEHALTQLQFDSGKPVMASVTIRPRDAHERVVSAPALPRIPVQSGAGDPSPADYALSPSSGKEAWGGCTSRISARSRARWRSRRSSRCVRTTDR